MLLNGFLGSSFYFLSGGEVLVVVWRLPRFGGNWEAEWGGVLLKREGMRLVAGLWIISFGCAVCGLSGGCAGLVEATVGYVFGVCHFFYCHVTAEISYFIFTES